MRPIANWSTVKAPTEFVELPVGGYVCKIMGAEVKIYTSSKSGESFEKLEVSIDIAEGDFADYYADNYRAQNEPKRWKGVLSYYVPKDDGTDSDEWSKTTLKGLTDAVEASNLGYKWEWDEKTLKGKRIGVLFRKEEWAYDGKTGWVVRPFKAIDATNAAAGNYRMPKDKPLKNSASSTQAASYTPNFEDVGNDEELPF